MFSGFSSHLVPFGRSCWPSNQSHSMGPTPFPEKKSLDVPPPPVNLMLVYCPNSFLLSNLHSFAYGLVLHAFAYGPDNFCHYYSCLYIALRVVVSVPNKQFRRPAQKKALGVASCGIVEVTALHLRRAGPPWGGPRIAWSCPPHGGPARRRFRVVTSCA